MQEKLAVIVDGWFVPLAVAETELFLELTQKHDQVQPISEMSTHSRGGTVQWL